MTHIRKVALLILVVESAVLWVVDQRRPPIPAPEPEHLPYLAATVVQFTVSTLTLTSANPNGTASTSGTVFVSTTAAKDGKAWNIQVQANSASLTNCAAVPSSAITVTCNSATFPAGDGNEPTGSCSAAFPLSTTPTTLASGTQGTKGDNYLVSATYQFADKWQYRGANSPACALTLTYSFYAAE